MRRRRNRPRYVAYVLVRREAGQIVDAQISPYRELQDRRWEVLLESAPAAYPDLARESLWVQLEHHPEADAILRRRNETCRLS